MSSIAESDRDGKSDDGDDDYCETSNSHESVASITQSLLDSIVKFGEYSSSDDNAVAAAGTAVIHNMLRDWNEELDYIIRSDPMSLFPDLGHYTTEVADDKIKETGDIVGRTVGTLCRILLSALVAGSTTTATIGDGDLDEENIKNGHVFGKLAQYRAHDRVNNGGADNDNDNDNDNAKNHRDNDALLMQSLRVAKNLLRVYNHFTMVYSSRSGVQKQLSHNDNNPIYPLKTKGIVSLYVSLLTFTNSSSSSNSTSRHPEVATHAGHCLFHSTYGSDDATSLKARATAFEGAETTEAGGGIHTLMKCLLSPDAPVTSYVPLTKIIHKMLGTSFHPLYQHMNTALEAITDEFCNTETNSYANIHELGRLSFKQNDTDSESDWERPYKIDIQIALVSTLAWIFRSKGDGNDIFPGLPQDKRTDVALEILNILFILQPITSKLATGKNYNRNDTTPIPLAEQAHYRRVLTQVGILIGDLIHLPNIDKNFYNVKLATVNLLMDAPLDYAHYLFVNKGIPPLMTVLTIQLHDAEEMESARIRNKTRSDKNSLAIKLMPILVVLQRLCAHHQDVKNYVKKEVFPNATTTKEEEKDTTTTTTGTKTKDKKLAPADAPKGSFRYKLIQLMTSIDSTVKRCSSELLWTLCDSDADEFVRRTGFGNAVHMLGIKGLMQMPTAE